MPHNYVWSVNAPEDSSHSVHCPSGQDHLVHLGKDERPYHVPSASHNEMHQQKAKYQMWDYYSSGKKTGLDGLSTQSFYP